MPGNLKVTPHGITNHRFFRPQWCKRSQGAQMRSRRLPVQACLTAAQVSDCRETPIACLCGQARPCKAVSEDSVRLL